MFAPLRPSGATSGGVPTVAGCLRTFASPLPLSERCAIYRLPRVGRRGDLPVAVKVELLYFDGCPSYERFLPRLRELIAGTEIAGDVELRRVESPEAAVAERFLGSPTVRVAGVDVEPGAGERDDFGLKCRLYRTAAGLRGTPAEEWVIQALNSKRRPDDGDSDLA